MEIVQNVAYEILGHSIYLEDGTETNNLLQENIVFTTRQGFVDRTMHGDDVQDDTPASYWISNPHNRRFFVAFSYFGEIITSKTFKKCWFSRDNLY